MGFNRLGSRARTVRDREHNSPRGTRRSQGGPVDRRGFLAAGGSTLGCRDSHTVFWLARLGQRDRGTHGYRHKQGQSSHKNTVKDTNQVANVVVSRIQHRSTGVVLNVCSKLRGARPKIEVFSNNVAICSTVQWVRYLTISYDILLRADWSSGSYVGWIRIDNFWGEVTGCERSRFDVVQG